MQYVGQTDQSLKTRFSEHFHKMKKLKYLIGFFIAIAKNWTHLVKLLFNQLKRIYDPHSSSIFKNIIRHETELKWIKFLQSPFPLGFMIMYTMKVMFLKRQILMGFFSFLECKKT